MADTIQARVGGHVIGDGQKLLLIAGPCVMENEAHALAHARKVKALAAKHGIPVIFKASFDKANRSSGSSFRGPGLEKGLAAFQAVKRETGLPCLTDVHETAQAEPAGRVVDVLQVPAFLCRQTDLVIACARHGRAVNVKKGQFLAPREMRHAISKCR
jgi:2-dehydro-3-deoxyphosphooctonate aldolase (KDO 8-P synthase)